MANEYLQRTPTSTGNRRVWTWGGWIKLNSLSTSFTSIMEAFTGSTDVYCTIAINSNAIAIVQDNGAGGVMQITASPLHRDPSSWFHLLVSVDTTQTLAQNRVRIYVNGDEEVVTYTTTPSINLETHYNRTIGHRIGTRWNLTGYINAEYTDVFFVDGQALTPDVFGFNKQGKGYISVGSTQATDFRPGQWVPKTPRVIKTEINRRGGFGVNGFYLPMNDSNNFGADFHGDPNSIITLNEKLPQPRVGVASTASVGLGYTDALRVDPYATNLILAVPGVIGGQGSGYGDYSATIKGSGSNKVVTANGNAGVAVTASYYGSALFFDGSGDYFDVAASSDYNFGTGDYTIECWINPLSVATAGNFKRIWNIGPSLGNSLCCNMESSDNTFKVRYNDTIILSSPAIVYTSQWSHVAVERYNNTLTLYVNGVSVGILTSHTTSYDYSSYSFRIGANTNDPTNSSHNGYIQDFRIYKGVAKYKRGFDVPRPYTPVGIATWRQVPDTTANNFATMNPLIEARPSSGTNSPSNSTIVTFAGGNLDLTNSASGGNAQRMYSFATIGITTGRWYWEVRAGSNDAVAITKGFQQKDYSGSGVLGSGSGLEASVAYYGGGSVSIANTAYYSTATTLTPPSYNTTNIIGIAVSANSGLNNLIVQWFKDGVGVSTVTGIGATSPVLEWFPSRVVSSSGSGGDTKYNFGQNPTFSGNTTAGTFTDANGKGLFKYQPPSGFLALCEDNLPTPAISDPGKYFKTVLYTGDGNSGRSIVGVGFTPDLVWIKGRTNATYDQKVWDSVRGPLIQLEPSSTQQEIAVSNSVVSFDSDGFDVGSYGAVNLSGSSQVAWCWRAGAGTTTANTAGSIPSVVSVNQDAGFSIVSWTGNGSAGTIGHGLGKTPAFRIIKDRGTTSNWYVWHKALAANEFLILNQTTAKTGSSSIWNNTLPTSTTISYATATTSDRFIEYVWAEIENFSKFGSYVGNGSADGPFVYCGFKPALVIIKNTSTGSTNWVIFDSSRESTNQMFRRLEANTSSVENSDNTTIAQFDFLSNGFKSRGGNGTFVNTSGDTYIFAAWAESPFQTANSK